MGFYRHLGQVLQSNWDVECGSHFYGKVGAWPPVGSLRRKGEYIKGEKVTLNLVIRFTRMLIKRNLIFQGCTGDTLSSNGK